MSKTKNPLLQQTVDRMKVAARLLNRCDLRGATESESRMFNEAEQAVRDGIAMIENPLSLFEAVPLEWSKDRLYGVELSVGRGLGLKYYVSPNQNRPGWSWSLGEGAGPDEDTEEAARAACQADFTERLGASIRPLGTKI
jgi:hypothetical protein